MPCIAAAPRRRAPASAYGKKDRVRRRRAEPAILRLGLVDELRLYVHPVVLGSGKPLFGDLQLDLRLLESRPVGNDVMLLRYAVVADP